jgi:thiopeptide-type bacteriocin biosynthesis protein
MPDRLRRLLARPDVFDALSVASPALAGQVETWRQDPDGDHGRRVGLALTRYLCRMVGRATPFGLFAGCTVGRTGQATRFHVGGIGRHTRLDMDYVVGLADTLSRDPALRPALRFTANTSLYRLGGRVRYLDVRREGKGWCHRRSSITLTDYLDAVLRRAEPGATPAELVRALLDHDAEAGEAEAGEYVADLIEQQVLVPELTPTVTGPEPIDTLVETLRAIPAGRRLADRLEAVRSELSAIDADGPGVHPERYRGLAENLSGLPAPVDPAHLIQVDSVRAPVAVELGENVVAEIRRGVDLLRRIQPPGAEPALAEFRRAFLARYGDTTVTRPVPLAEVLDNETGVGFGGETVHASGVLECLDSSGPTDAAIRWGRREVHLLGRLTETLAGGRHEMVLTSHDLDELSAPDPPPLPDALAVLARLEAASGEAVARGDYRLHLAAAVGPSGARLLGRFCHADAGLANLVERHLRAEEAHHPDAVFAEIVHLPEGRLGNILARPVCRGYEIPYLGRSAVPPDRQIPLSDLCVSVAGHRIVLTSARLGREVVPRLTNAHNYETGRGVYKFLSSLQSQRVSSTLHWDWGPLSSAAFLPRVSHGRLVLARARWQVSPAEITRLTGGDSRRRFDAVQHLRAERRLPRWVSVTDSDNELPIDLDDRALVDVLLGECHPGRPVTLTELVPDPAALCSVGPEGRYTNEIVVPFERERTASPASEAVTPNGSGRGDGSIANSVGRTFPPGSEWLTLKLYAGHFTIESLLRDVLGPLAVRLTAAGDARRWFFVRYADPHPHLRLRFHGDPGRLWDTVLPAVRTAVAPFVEGGRIWKTQIDTYTREVERYGGPVAVELCETLFHYDSEAAVELLPHLTDDPRADRRWRLALLGADRLLTDLCPRLDDQRTLLRRARDDLRVELKMTNEVMGRIGDRFRSDAREVTALLGTNESDDWATAKAIFHRRSRSNEPVIARLNRVITGRWAESAFTGLTTSVLHMFLNRLLLTAHLPQELILYEYLLRDRNTQAARGVQRRACAQADYPSSTFLR